MRQQQEHQQQQFRTRKKIRNNKKKILYTFPGILKMKFSLFLIDTKTTLGNSQKFYSANALLKYIFTFSFVSYSPFVPLSPPRPHQHILIVIFFSVFPSHKDCLCFCSSLKNIHSKCFIFSTSGYRTGSVVLFLSSSHPDTHTHTNKFSSGCYTKFKWNSWVRHVEIKCSTLWLISLWYTKNEKKMENDVLWCSSCVLWNKLKLEGGRKVRCMCGKIKIT